MKRIYKYPLKVQDKQIIEIQGDILSVKNQGDNIMLYALTDDNCTPIKYSILIIGTGHPIDNIISDYNFLGTVALFNAGLMFHVFYTKE